MGNLISFLQEIFMMKEDNSTKIGLSSFKQVSTPVDKKPTVKYEPPKELKISELIRKGNY